MKHYRFKISLFFILIVILSITVRITFLAKVPPALYSDEADQGYNAYSILLTGKDEHGVFLPVSLRSFGDWKPPLPTYLMIPFVYLLGLNEVSVRLPSVILGIGTVMLTFFLCRELLSSTKLALLSSLFLAISPWHILQSRSAMLVMIALFFLESGVYFFIKGNKNYKYLIISSLSFALSIYAYYGMRVVTPLVILLLVIYYRQNFTRLLKLLIISLVIGFLILIPILAVFVREPDVIFGRAKTVSVFYDQGVKLRQWELISQDGRYASTIISRLFHNNIYMYGRNILQRFLSHFDPRYLFIIGDQSPPFQIPNMGILYLADAFSILTGMILLARRKSIARAVIFSWAVISFVPAALTFMTPSGNRTFSAVVPYATLSAIGVLAISKLTSKRMLTAGMISLVYIFSFGYFLKQYFYNLPIYHADFWNYGWRQVFDYTKSAQDSYNQIVLSDVGMPYIYLLFYAKSDPAGFQKEAIRTYKADEFGFEHVEGFGKYIFLRDFKWEYIKNNLQRKTIYVVAGKEAKDELGFVKSINYPDGKIAYKIFIYE